MLKISQAVIENGFAYTLLFYSRLARLLAKSLASSIYSVKAWLCAWPLNQANPTVAFCGARQGLEKQRLHD
jgi:hypothetical protein